MSEPSAPDRRLFRLPISGLVYEVLSADLAMLLRTMAFLEHSFPGTVEVTSDPQAERDLLDWKASRL